MTVTLYLTDELGVRQAQIDDYHTGKLTVKDGDVGVWSVEVPSDGPTAAAILASPNDRTWRIEARLDPDTVICEGPLTGFTITADDTGTAMLLTGATDELSLRNRLTHPSPIDGNANGQNADTFIGTIPAALNYYVDRNAGPSAQEARQVPGLTVAATPATGPYTWKGARWENLLTFLQSIAGPAGWSFRIRALEFQPFQPAQSGAVFSVGAGTLGQWVMKATGPTGNYVYVGASGTNENRLFFTRSNAESIAAWGRVETFVNQSSTSDQGQMNQAAADALTKGCPSDGVELAVLETQGQQYGRDYQLGDLVTVQLPFVTFVERIRQVVVDLKPGDRPVITPSVGQPPRSLNLFKTLRDLQSRVGYIERTP